ncbi:hypothetical protein BMS3Abin05_02526 [bacterium BMS3Abin05]|nr:hypothetical protein BMS3Abin05_02526 [bacterium BMS3Abin05]GBE27496.1 hypothetical protein BMS3Bbin03_01421 [bacterium BMS3Bbin03]
MALTRQDASASFLFIAPPAVSHGAAKAHRRHNRLEMQVRQSRSSWGYNAYFRPFVHYYSVTDRFNLPAELETTVLKLINF